MIEPPNLETYPYYDEIRKNSRGLAALFYRLLPIPLHVFYPLRLEIYLFMLRMSGFLVRRRYKGKQNLLVNVGSGSKGLTGWVNIDMFKFPGVNCLFDARKSLPFPDETVKVIFCEHFFEHLDYTEEVPYFLSECKRVLTKGGVLRIIIPDAGRYLSAYVSDGWHEMASLRPLIDDHVDYFYKFQYRTKMELVNMIFRQGYRHKYAYDYQTLEAVLFHYKFSRVIKQSYLKSCSRDLDIDSEERASESLYVEAIV